jgi:N-alpha-acetyltransferase 40
MNPPCAAAAKDPRRGWPRANETDNRTGLGTLLIDFHESAARHTPSVEKVMLTCFTRNSSAFQFYRRLGFDIDPISPEPKKLRSGKESVPDYVIMSKTIT